MASDRALGCRLRFLRTARGLGQAELARQAGVTRQAIGVIEAGRYFPNTLVALRLARILNCTVEDIFGEADVGSQPLTLASTTAAPLGARVSVARIHDRLVGYPLIGATALQDGLAVAQGLISQRRGKSRRPARPGQHPASVRLLVSERQLDQTALLLGCDPAFAVLCAHIALRGDVRVQSHFASSQRALDALRNREAHVAGCHLINLADGESNIAQATRALGPAGGLVVTFARWEQGLMVARGNPKRIRAVSDLARRGVVLVNRELGSGSRHLLDGLLIKEGVSTRAINGYGTRSTSHFDAARRIQNGLADAAIGLRAVAEACGIGFEPLAMVRCDLVIPRDHLTHPAIRGMLETLNSSSLRDDLRALPGYESATTGTIVVDLPHAA